MNQWVSGTRDGPVMAHARSDLSGWFFLAWASVLAASRVRRNGGERKIVGRDFVSDQAANANGVPVDRRARRASIPV